MALVLDAQAAGQYRRPSTAPKFTLHAINPMQFAFRTLPSFWAHADSPWQERSRHKGPHRNPVPFLPRDSDRLNVAHRADDLKIHRATLPTPYSSSPEGWLLLRRTSNSTELRSCVHAVGGAV
jgi:hypothetical protein